MNTPSSPVRRALLRSLAISFAALFLSASAADRSALDVAIGQARVLVETQIAPKVPGVSVAVAVDGQVVWSQGFGYADLAEKKPVTPATRFRIGSISKSLTAVGLMLLVERGQLDLDAPVQRYVPEFPEKDVVITTRQLAGHLGGIRHYRGNEMHLNRPFADARASLKIFDRDPLEAPPGTKYIYTTYGWTLISAVMESAARQDFLAYMETAVLRPLALAQTRADHKGATDPDCTRFYAGEAPDKFTPAPAVDNSYKWAGGGYLSTPEDLVRFGSALLQPGFLKTDTLALMFTQQKTADGKATDYGIGWRIGRDAAGHRVMLHTGGSIGGTSVLLLHPATRTVVALVCNHSKSPFTKENWEPIAESFAPVFASKTAPRR
ncbi:MAG: serine hydrolase domain-containing protein [Opitutaceae bacterium]|nr:serine hydrolase domain-containing protein [Opitutaceae bacterium]